MAENRQCSKHQKATEIKEATENTREMIVHGSQAEKKST